MLTYKAMYKFLETGVHGEVLDFPGVITCGKDLEETRQLLSSALVDMAETNLGLGESLPTPNSTLSNSEADLEEPIHLVLTATTRVKISPETHYEAA
jgi:predicted RNase H-like HicB family nuclease